MGNKQMDSIFNHSNSFDDYFINYTKGTRLYVSPLIETEKALNVFNSSPILWNEKTNGFFFSGDQIITNIDDPNDHISNRCLTLVNPTRFYSVYKDVQQDFYYIFFSKESTEYLVDYHGYLSSDEVVGALTLYINHNSIMGSQNEALTLLITNKPVGDKYACWSLENYVYNEMLNESLQNIGTRYLKMSLIFKLAHDLGIMYDFCVKNDELDQELISCINERYNSLSDEKKDMCHLVLPSIYKFVHNTEYSKTISENIVRRYINNLYTITSRNKIAGQIGLIRMQCIGEKEVKLIEKTYKYIFGFPQVVLSRDNENQIARNVVVLYLINRSFTHVRRALGVSSLWLYYMLYYLRKSTENTLIYNLASILIQCTLYTNKEDFIPIISNVKRREFVLNFPKLKTSWEFKSDVSCMYELLFYFNDSVDFIQKDNLEQTILGRIPNMSDGYNIETICQHLNGDVNHSWMGIDEEREFYANAIYLYIEEQIQLDTHFGYE